MSEEATAPARIRACDVFGNIGSMDAYDALPQRTLFESHPDVEESYREAISSICQGRG